MTELLNEQIDIMKKINDSFVERIKRTNDHIEYQKNQLEALKKLYDEMSRICEESKVLEGTISSIEHPKDFDNKSLSSLSDQLGTNSKFLKNSKSEASPFAKALKKLGVAASLVTALSISSVIKGIVWALRTAKESILAMFEIGGLVLDLAKMAISVVSSLYETLIDAAHELMSGGGSDYAQAIHDLKKEFGALNQATPAAILDMSRNMSAIKEVGLSVRRIFGNRGELIKEFLSEIAVKMGPLFEIFASEFADSRGAILGVAKGMGYSGEEMESIAADSITNGTSLTKTLGDIHSQTFRAEKKFGNATKNINRDVAKALKNVKHFGGASKEAIVNASLMARKLGLDVEKISPIMDKTQTLEDISELGINMIETFNVRVDSFEMLDSQDPGTTVDHLRKQFKKSGVETSKLSRSYLNLLSAQTGLAPEIAQQALSGLNAAESLDEIKEATEEKQKKPDSIMKILYELRDAIEYKVLSGGSFDGGFIDMFILGLKKGFFYHPLTRGMLRNIGLSLKAAYRGGISFFNLFAKAFPGFEGIIKSFSQFFNPEKFSILVTKINNAFIALISGAKDRSYTVTKLFSDIRQAFEDHLEEFKKVDGGKLYESFKSGLSTIGQIIGSAFAYIGEVFSYGILYITDLISGKEDFIKKAKGFLSEITPGLESVFDPVTKSLEKSTDSISKASKRLFSVIEKKYDLSNHPLVLVFKDGVSFFEKAQEKAIEWFQKLRPILLEGYVLIKKAVKYLALLRDYYRGQAALGFSLLLLEGLRFLKNFRGLRAARANFNSNMGRLRNVASKAFKPSIGQQAISRIFPRGISFDAIRFSSPVKIDPLDELNKFGKKTFGSKFNAEISGNSLKIENGLDDARFNRALKDASKFKNLRNLSPADRFFLESFRSEAAASRNVFSRTAAAWRLSRAQAAYERDLRARSKGPGLIERVQSSFKQKLNSLKTPNGLKGALKGGVRFGLSYATDVALDYLMEKNIEAANKAKIDAIARKGLDSEEAYDLLEGPNWKTIGIGVLMAAVAIGAIVFSGGTALAFGAAIATGGAGATVGGAFAVATVTVSALALAGVTATLWEEGEKVSHRFSENYEKEIEKIKNGGKNTFFKEYREKFLAIPRLQELLKKESLDTKIELFHWKNKIDYTNEAFQSLLTLAFPDIDMQRLYAAAGGALAPKAIEALIKEGAFEEFDPKNPSHVETLNKVLIPNVNKMVDGQQKLILQKRLDFYNQNRGEIDALWKQHDDLHKAVMKKHGEKNNELWEQFAKDENFKKSATFSIKDAFIRFLKENLQIIVDFSKHIGSFKGQIEKVDSIFTGIGFDIDKLYKDIDVFSLVLEKMNEFFASDYIFKDFNAETVKAAKRNPGGAEEISMLSTPAFLTSVFDTVSQEINDLKNFISDTNKFLSNSTFSDVKTAIFSFTERIGEFSRIKEFLNLFPAEFLALSKDTFKGNSSQDLLWVSSYFLSKFLSPFYILISIIQSTLSSVLKINPEGELFSLLQSSRKPIEELKSFLNDFFDFFTLFKDQALAALNKTPEEKSKPAEKKEEHTPGLKLDYSKGILSALSDFYEKNKKIASFLKTDSKTPGAPFVAQVLEITKSKFAEQVVALKNAAKTFESSIRSISEFFDITRFILGSKTYKDVIKFSSYFNNVGNELASAVQKVESQVIEKKIKPIFNSIVQIVKLCHERMEALRAALSDFECHVEFNSVSDLYSKEGKPIIIKKYNPAKGIKFSQFDEESGGFSCGKAVFSDQNKFNSAFLKKNSIFREIMKFVLENPTEENDVLLEKLNAYMPTRPKVKKEQKSK
jgi:hypothetical protein